MENFLVMGDVHGNLPALEKLFIEESSIDLFICHGDVVNYGPWSNECVQLLNSKKNCICLRGNHERYFISSRYEGENLLVKQFFDFCISRFTELQSILRYSESFRIGEYVIQHTLFDKYLFVDTPVDKIDSNYIIGHSHQQFKRKIGNFSLINTGSLGQNRNWINVSNYVVGNLKENSVMLKSFIFDVDLLINKMKREGYPQSCLDYYRNKKRV